MSTELLTVDEAAARVRLSPWTIRRAIQRGEIDAYKPAGRLRVPVGALERWLTASKVSPEFPRSAPAPGPLPLRFPRSTGRFRACLEDEHARR